MRAVSESHSSKTVLLLHWVWSINSHLADIITHGYRTNPGVVHSRPGHFALTVRYDHGFSVLQPLYRASSSVLFAPAVDVTHGVGERVAFVRVIRDSYGTYGIWKTPWILVFKNQGEGFLYLIPLKGIFLGM